MLCQHLRFLQWNHLPMESGSQVTRRMTTRHRHRCTLFDETAARTSLEKPHTFAGHAYAKFSPRDSPRISFCSLVSTVSTDNLPCFRVVALWPTVMIKHVYHQGCKLSRRCPHTSYHLSWDSSKKLPGYVVHLGIRRQSHDEEHQCLNWRYIASTKNHSQRKPQRIL